MEFEKIQVYLSAQRIDRYLQAVNNNEVRAVEFYKANLKIAQSFHPLLGVLEVKLRNCINVALANYFSDPDWIINQKSGFMIDSTLTYMNMKTGQSVKNEFLKSSVEKSEKRFIRLKAPVTSGKIIADQSFGFWTDLFEVHHYKLLAGRPIKIFSNLPTGEGRKSAFEKLTSIRQFRNRINHNEPICFKGAKIDFTYVYEVYKAIKDILSWIDPEILNWIGDIDEVNSILAEVKKI